MPEYEGSNTPEHSDSDGSDFEGSDFDGSDFEGSDFDGSDSDGSRNAESLRCFFSSATLSRSVLASCSSRSAFR
ncbi:TPA: pentapeptide repeat-containing protein [Escherichia coli]